MAGLAVALLMAAGATFGDATPAQAAGWTDCPSSATHVSGYVCLWENANYTGGRWQASKATLSGGLSGGVSGCYNLTGSSYTNGHAVYDTAGSWAIRAAASVYPKYSVIFYEWANCNSSGNSREYLADGDYAVSDLSTLTPNWNDTVASIRVI
jgi:hypothetical protein